MMARSDPREGEQFMRQTMVRRLVMVASLAMILSVARPGAVQARELRGGGSWGWLQQLWAQGISSLWGGPAAPEPARGARALQKDGGSIGWPKTPSSPDAVTTTSDQGNGMDPNG